MSKIISGDSLTAYERWELPSMDPRQDGQSDRASPSLEAGVETKAERNGAQRTPATLEEIETIQRAAQEEGFAAGYQEGRKEGRDQGYQKGHQEGHANGYQTGYAEGLAAAQEEIKIRVEKLEQILDFMAHPLRELDAAVEEELAYLTTEIARQLVRRELKAAPGEIVAVVRETVALLPAASQSVRVHLHPDDVLLVRDALALSEGESNWRLIEDHALSRGGCIVHTEMSRIDASVEKRLGGVIAKVLGDERGRKYDHP